MATKKRKIPAVDQYQYIVERGNRYTGEIKFKNTDKDRVLMNIYDKCSFLDEQETHQLFRALHRVGTVQFGRAFHERCLTYVDGVTVIEDKP